MTLSITVEGFGPGDPIPPEFAFCAGGGMGDNRSPRVSWSGVPEAAVSLVLICVDTDAPTVADDVNVEGRTVSAELPRADFYHWVLYDIDPGVTEIAAGAASDAVTPKGKPADQTPVGVAGLNDYTGWFAGDPDMEGRYHGYDGPCPPANDELVHHYHFKLLAIDAASLRLGPGATGAEVMAAAEPCVLAEAGYEGTYTLNPALA
jgi:Raf kinase inhibitor-like YbhB/YbcL family protein